MIVKRADTDIDIDFQDPKKALVGLNHIRAAMFDDEGNSRAHQSGIFFQGVPYDPITGLCTISNEEAEDRGYFKLDFLRVHQYDGIRDEDHLVELMHREPIWEMLEDKFFVKQLSQIHQHFDVVSAYAPKTMIQLAMILGMIRPAKSYLQGMEWVDVEKSIWVPPQEGDKGYEYRKSYFKKPHAVSYSFGIIVQMNHIIEKASI